MYVLKNTCPFCGHETDHTTDPGDSIAFPVPGDPSICWKCAGVSVFDDKLDLRKPTPAEKADFDKDKDVQEALACLRTVKEGA